MKMRHDDQIRQVRGRLIARGSELNDRIRRVHTDLGRLRDPLPRDSADAAIRMENDEVLRAIEDTATSEMHHISHALERIDAGAFGVCEACGSEIDLMRLDVIPYATRCGRCERKD